MMPAWSVASCIAWRMYSWFTASTFVSFVLKLNGA